MAGKVSLDIIRNNLVLYLDATNTKSYTSGSSTWFDLSGNNNNFTLYNGVGFSNNNGGSLTLDGTNDYIASTSNLNLTSYDYVAIELFYKSNNLNLSILLEHTTNWNSNTGGLGLGLNTNGNNTISNSNHTNHNTEVPKNYLVSNNQSWNNNLNLFSRISDSTGRLTYTNGLLTPFSASGIYTSTTTTNAGGSFANAIFYIGSRAGSSFFFNGSISSLKIYGFKINASQALQNYNTNKTRFGL